MKRFAVHVVICSAALLAWFALPVGLLADEILVEDNIVYGRGGDRDLTLRLARPAEGDGPFPAIVYVHGGGWQAGNRDIYKKEIERAAERGYVAVTITYRLTEADENGKARHPFPAAINDAKCAVRWMRANADKYHVDPQRIGAKGGSAGGHLSLLLGLTDESHQLEGNGGHAEYSSRVQAVVNYYGPTDMPQAYASVPRVGEMINQFLAGKPDEIPEVYSLASPMTHLTRDDPPILTIHGSLDELVHRDQAIRFDELAGQVGVAHTLMMLEGQGHGFKGEARAKAEEATFEFFDRHLKGK